MKRLAMTLALALAASAAMAETATVTDPNAYLDEIEGDKALAFARELNAKTLPVLKGDPRYEKLYGDALAIATAQDRIPAVGFADDGTLRNYWQDKEHVRGIWRATDLASYKAGAPAWQTILDLDAVAKAERGERRFSVADIVRLALEFDCPVDRLIFGDRPRPRLLRKAKVSFDE